MIQLQPSYNSNFSADLMSEIKQNRKKYNQLSQISYYASLESIEQLGIFTKSSCDVQCNVVFCYNSEKYDSKIRREISYYILRTLNDQIPKLKNKYSLAYVHENISGFLYFRNIIRLMPADFMARLKDFYIVHSGLGLRIVQLFSFGEINSYLKSKAIYIQRIDEIQTNNKITLGGDAVLKSKMRLAQERQSFRNNVRLTKEMQSSDVNIIRNKLYGKQVSQYELSAHGIPIFIETLIITLYSKMDFLRAEGIMRKSCDVQQLEVLETHLMEDQNWRKYVASCDDPYVLCGCVKKIFNNLNTPLFSYEIYDLIVSYRSDGHIQNDITFMRSCISKMGKINRMVMLYMIAFLKKGIITYVQDNKMSAYNLAVVFGPCFFRPKQYRLEDLMSSGRFSFMIKLLLENYQKMVTQEIAISMYNLLQKQKDSLV